MRAKAGVVGLALSAAFAAALAGESWSQTGGSATGTKAGAAASGAEPQPPHPSPPARPHDLAMAPSSAPELGPDGADRVAGAACLRTLRARGADLAPVPASGAQGDCAIPVPVGFKGLSRPDGSTVLLDSPVTIRCTLALELASWLEELLRIAERHGAGVARLTGVGGHACRSRNAQAGAPVSEHASGNAFDLRALTLKGGRVLELNQAEPGSKALREEIRKSVCERFRTVLGAGSDSFHADHLHLDMRERPRGARLCQWLIE
jgi:hypothetical protein